MSEEREVYLDALQLRDTALNWEIACHILFSERHFYVRSREDAHEVVRSRVPTLTHDGEEPETYYYLLAPAREVAARLRVYGYSESKMRQLWDQAREEALRSLPASLRTLTAYEPEEGPSISEQAEKVRTQTFENWRASFASNVRSRARNGWVRGVSGLLEVQLWDTIAEVALCIEAFEPEFVWIDFSDLYPSEEFPEGVPIQTALLARDKQYEDDTIGNVLVLTEGKSDSRIISLGLRHLYPHLEDIFSFVDFEGFRIEGGASPLARMVKTFAGVKQATRIVAVFDNDAAGFEALNSLSTLSLPPNMRTINLPEIALARNYPTIGPEGLRHMNVNGSACTIELFLGREALTGADGNLHPIRWSQWNKQAGRYQGSVEGKSEVEQRFFRLLTDPQGCPKSLRARFPEMNSLLRAIFTAFE